MNEVKRLLFILIKQISYTNGGKGCSIDNHSIFCIDNWAFDISSSIGIKFNDPLSELLGL